MEETWVQANEKPEAITYEKLPSGKANVYLRKDFEEVEQTSINSGELQSQKVWRYHEKNFLTDLTEDEVKENFEMLYLTADAPVPKLAEIVDNLSDMVDDLAMRVDELEGA